MNFFALMLVVACLFNTTAFGMTRAEIDRPKNIFVYLDGEIDPTEENDLIKLHMAVMGDDTGSVVQILYTLGVGMTHVPFKNDDYETKSTLNKHGVVSFYYANELDGKMAKTGALYQASGFFYVRAGWEIEYKWYDMTHPNFGNADNNEKYKKLLADLTADVQRQRNTAKEERKAAEEEDEREEEA